MIPNQYFLNHDFYDADGNRLEKPNAEIIQKLYEITGIRERRYVADGQTTTDIAHLAAEQAQMDRPRPTLPTWLPNRPWKTWIRKA